MHHEKNTIVSDEQIIDMYWKRDENAIQATDCKYGVFLYRISYNILHDMCDCEECQNDTYLKIWNAIPPTRPVMFKAFIAQIVRRISINRYKEKTNQKRIPSELTVSIEELGDSLSISSLFREDITVEELGKIITKYVRGLSDRQQYIFIARFYMAESVERIAGEMKITPSAVYKELGRLKERLRIFLEENGVYV